MQYARLNSRSTVLTSAGWCKPDCQTEVFGVDRHGKVVPQPVSISHLREPARAVFVARFFLHRFEVGSSSPFSLSFDDLFFSTDLTNAAFVESRSLTTHTADKKRIARADLVAEAGDGLEEAGDFVDAQDDG